MTTADLIIVGAGLAGSAAAWAAARRDRSVVVLEAFAAGHRLGSSHGSARIFRRAYPDPLYVGLTGRAGELWRELEDEAREPQPLLRLTGGVDFGPRRNPEGLHDALTAGGVPAELLSPGQAAERWPGISFGGGRAGGGGAGGGGPGGGGPGGGRVLFHAEAGVLDADRAMAAMLRLAAERGADVRLDTPVTRLAATPGGGAIAHTDSGTFTAPVIAVAAGAWITPLVGGFVELPALAVTQQQVFHFAPRDQPADRPADRPADNWPIFICQDDIDDFYGLPGGQDGEVPGAIKLGEHGNGTATTADGRDFAVDPGARQRAITFAGRRLPGLNSTPVNAVTCLYTSTASEDFILDRQGPFVIASACSGHGAKFAPLLGEIIAGLAAGEPTADPRFTLAAHRGH